MSCLRRVAGLVAGAHRRRSLILRPASKCHRSLFSTFAKQLVVDFELNKVAPSDGKGYRPKLPLVVMIPWKGSNLDAGAEYRKVWTERGFDVLQVKTDLADIVLCPPDTAVNAMALRDQWHSLRAQYRKVVVHLLASEDDKVGELLMEVDLEQLFDQHQLPDVVELAKAWLMESLFVSVARKVKYYCDSELSTVPPPPPEVIKLNMASRFPKFRRAGRSFQSQHLPDKHSQAQLVDRFLGNPAGSTKEGNN